MTGIDIIILVFWGLAGLTIGSFLNVCIYRLPKKESIVTGPSHCVSCGERIKKHDLIPVLSYLLLGGKCRSCKAKISPRYMFVELITGALFILIALKYQYSVLTALYSVFAAALIVLTFIDFETKTIPNGIVIFIFAVGIILTILSVDLVWYERVIGLFCVSLFLLLIAIIVRGGMGGGDIKLMAAAGLVLGWKLIIFSFLVGSILASVYGLIFARRNHVGVKAVIPFGPFLAAAMVISIFVGQVSINWYLGLF